MKKELKIFKYSELGLVFLSAISVWYWADRVFKTSYENWSWLVFFALLFFVCWSLGSIVIRNNGIFLGVTLVALLSQVVFTRNIGTLVVVLISFLLFYLARIFIRQEIKLRLNVDIWNYLRVGRRFLVVALALMIAGQYYFSSNPQITLESIPKFKFEQDKGGFMTKIVSIIDPSLIKENKEAVVVDEFIINEFNENPSAARRFDKDLKFDNLDFNQRAVVLASGKENISEMAGRNVGGDEKMVDIFLEIVNNKINAVSSINVESIDKEMPLSHLIFTLAIFVLIMGSGMMMGWILIPVIFIIFKLLVFSGVLSIDRKAVNMEVIKIG
ncbi:MAG: hypothetical protein UR60_C0044G0013 [Candidatus Moranbacteria bacterium GW2011_GWF2_34_56]|nr:MAG: hypothetical protein UR51_C0022G0012 [Candidatus Moranbacteria bacterium GW2011_GWF1_34_10]KKP63439.1 MAG: hypothetical protein UR60_C0044G0013 [Candidatus Moranbacteria bacterium GW2011_GWF2_34_56]